MQRNYVMFLLLTLFVSLISGCVSTPPSPRTENVTPPISPAITTPPSVPSPVPTPAVVNESRLLTGENVQIKIFEERIRGMLKNGTLPIIDAEFHYGGDMDIDKLIHNMDRNGVALTWLGPNENQGSEESIRLNKLYPDRFVPTTVHGDGQKWHGSDNGFLEKLGNDVRSGRYFAMGEFEARHYPSNTNNRDVHMPVDSKAMQVVFLASSDTGIPFVLHHEAEDELLPELERMLVKYPEVKVIWAHAGRNRNPVTWAKFSRPDAVREFLNKYPNLYFDFLASKPGSRYQTGYVEGIMYDVTPSGASLNPEWKKLIEDFPDRFVLGSDVNSGRFGEYDRVMNTYRTIILQGVREDVAEKIAYKNAWKLMTGEDWKD
ncbi:MAG: amidohydrolase family protein [Candidatus Methanoperedens sp.]